MAEVALRAEVRTGRGKGVARRLRADGKVPAVLYGRGIDPVALAVDARTLQQTLSTDAGINVLIDLQVDGSQHLTLARSLDRDPLRGAIRHVDFLKIARDQKITVDVPVHLDGEASGVKEGGVLEHHLWQLHVSCFPTDVPERINIDVTRLAIGDSVHVSDIVAPSGVEILTAADEIVVSCVVPQVLKVEAELEEAPLAEGAVAPAAEGEEAPAAEGEEAPSEED